ncbi:EAL domain-containing protein [Pseudomonas sp. SA3-5]|uniref:EAL domain-containing protein n=1 Tax=Pseudomonas aestuarii TaxID=3018340 RepID=A0ABT4XDG0_9PSED|nr:bifunctional diguanylate cyclase/phosphodiesterase [Pseudomonas aestuarii]MDA7086227.1 EAL domain-containing protein [Pseudomonas aestuarii]
MKDKRAPEKCLATSASPGAALRQMAEEIIGGDAQESRKDLPLLTPEAMQQALHELHVHQIELEMQNEELRQAQAKIEDAKERYFDLYDLAPVGYLTLSVQGSILQANLTATHLLDVVRAELIKRPITRFIYRDDQDIFYQLCRRLISTGEPQTCELRMIKSGGALLWAHLDATQAHDESGASALRIVLSDFSARKRAEDALQESYQALHSILDATLDGFWRIDVHGDILDVNPTYCEQSGYSREELLQMNVLDLEVVECAAATAQQTVSLIETGHGQFETIHRRKDGSLWQVEVSSTYRDAAGGQVFVFLRDISKRKQAEEKLQLAANVFSHSREGIMITAADGSIINVNAAFTHITGYSRDEAIGQNPRILRSGRHASEFFESMWHNLSQKGHWCGEIWNRRKNGEIYAEMQTISCVRDSNGEIVQYVALFSDITEIKAHQSKLEHIAHFDALTSLPNRVLLADRLRHAIAQAQRRGQLLEVVYLDLDGFKAINDQHGHEAGDKLLIALSAKMKQALRECDTLARIGGDEFVAVLVDLPDVATSMPMLNRLLAAAAQVVHVGDLALQVSASMGVTFCPQQDEVDADQLMRQADQAMYQAKLAGKNRLHFFDVEQDRSVRGHHESLEHIRLALVEREFILYYQPKVNMRTGEVIGVEALIRWRHPHRGLLAPAIFLPVIEDHLLAIEIGEWAINRALAQMEAWQKIGLDIEVSVNIGARQLQQKNFVDRLRAILQAHPQVKPSRLQLEILETSALEDVAHVFQVIEACREIGVMFALDDFGTGYSSLTYLKHLPVALLKIDQSFVLGMLDDPDDLSILKGVVGLASAFRLEIIAEGVESLEHGALLLQLGCEQAQGFGIAAPMAAEELPHWVATWWGNSDWRTLPSASKEDLARLMASVELRAWIKAIDNYLKGERATPPSLDWQQSYLSQWLRGIGLDRRTSHPSFAALDKLHTQINVLASEVCDLHAKGHKAKKQARLDELHDLQDNMLEQLKTLA